MIYTTPHTPKALMLQPAFLFAFVMLVAFALSTSLKADGITSSSLSFKVQEQSSGGGSGRVSSANFLSSHHAGGIGDAQTSSSASFRSNEGAAFSPAGSGSNRNLWLGTVSNDARDARNWSNGIPSDPNAFANIVEISPQTTQPLLDSGSLQAQQILIQSGAKLEVLGTASLELGSASETGRLEVQPDADLILSGTPTIQGSSAAAGAEILIEGNLFVSGMDLFAGVVIQNLASSGLQLSGFGDLQVVNLEIRNGESDGVLIDYLRDDIQTIEGLVFSDTSFGPSGANIRASGAGELEVRITESSFGGPGWGEDFDDDASGSVIWVVTTTPPAEPPKFEISVGSAQQASANVLQGAKGVILAQFRIQAFNGKGALSGFHFEREGSSIQTSVIKRLRLFQDLNSNGIRELNEPQLGSQLDNPGTSASFSFPTLVVDAESFFDFLIVADFVSSFGSNGGASLAYTLSAAADVFSEAPDATSQPLGVEGSFPLFGTQAILGITARPQLGRVTLSVATAQLGQTGLQAEATVLNTGTNQLNLSSLGLFAQKQGAVQGTTHEKVSISPTNFSLGQQATLAPGSQTIISADFDLPSTLFAGSWLIGMEVFGTDNSLNISVSDLTPSSLAPLTILEALSFITSSLPPATENISYTAFIEAQGGTAPLSLSLDDPSQLPAGLQFEPTGIISGKPQVNGTFPFDVTLNDASSQSVSGSFSIIIDAPPTSTGGSTKGSIGGDKQFSILTLSLPGALQTFDYFFQLNAFPGTGSWSITEGALPPGLDLSPGGSISGIPADLGVSEFVVEVREGTSFASQPLSLEVFDPAPPTSTTPVIIPFGAASGLNVSASPTSNVLTDFSGGNVLPADVSNDPALNFVDIESEDLDGASLVSVKYFDIDRDGTLNQGDVLRIRTSEVLLLANATLDSLQISNNGTFGNGAFLAPGANPTGFEIVLGQTPSFVVDSDFIEVASTNSFLDTNGNVMQVSSALITAGSALQKRIDLLSLNGEDVQEFSIVSILWQTTPAADLWKIDIELLQDGSALSGLSPLATALPDSGLFEWQVPGGLAGDGYEILLTGHNETSGLDFIDRSSFTFEILGDSTSSGGQLTSLSGRNARGSGSLTGQMNAPLRIQETQLEAEVGLNWNDSLGASGGKAPYTWTILSGELPAGISLSPTTGILQGIPLKAETTACLVELKDSKLNASRSLVSIQVYPPLRLQKELQVAYLNSAYTGVLSAQDGKAPYTWSITAGSLPPGVELQYSLNFPDNQTIFLQGTPTQVGIFQPTLQLSDALGATRIHTLSFEVKPAKGLVFFQAEKMAELELDTLRITQNALLSPQGINGMESMVYDAVQRRILALHKNMIVSLELDTHDLTPIVSIQNKTLKALAHNPYEGLVYSYDSSNHSLVKIDLKTGETSKLATLLDLPALDSLSFDPARRVLYATAQTAAGEHKLFELDPSGVNAPQSLGAFSLSGGVGALCFLPSEKRCFMLEKHTGKIWQTRSSLHSGGQSEIKLELLTELPNTSFQGLAWNHKAQTFLSADTARREVVALQPEKAALSRIASYGYQFSDFAFDAKRSRLYTMNAFNDRLLMLDGFSGEILQELGSYQGVRGLSFDAVNERLIGTNPDRGHLVSIDLETAQAETFMNHGLEGYFVLTGDFENNRIYAYNQKEHTLLIIHGNSIEKELSIKGQKLSGISFDSVNSRLLGSLPDQKAIVEINLLDGNVGALKATGFALREFVFNSGNQSLLGFDLELKQLITLDINESVSQGFISSISLAGLTPGAMAFDAHNNSLYLLDSERKTFFKFDYTRNEVSTYFAPALSDFQGLAYDQEKSILYGMSAQGELFELNPSTGARTLIFDTKVANLQGLTFRPSTQELWASIPGVGFAIIDLETQSVKELQLQDPSIEISGLEFDKATETLYGVDQKTGMFYLFVISAQRAEAQPLALPAQEKLTGKFALKALEEQ